MQVLAPPLGVGRALINGSVIAPWLAGLCGEGDFSQPLWPKFGQGFPPIFQDVRRLGDLPARGCPNEEGRLPEGGLRFFSRGLPLIWKGVRWVRAKFGQEFPHIGRG